MFPGLRLGYMVVPAHLIDAFKAVRRITDTHPPMIAQPALAEFVAAGHLAQHIRRMRALYAERQRRFLDAARDILRPAPRPRAGRGRHAPRGLPAPGVDDRAVSAPPRARGIEAPALSAFYVAEAPVPGPAARLHRRHPGRAGAGPERPRRGDPQRRCGGQPSPPSEPPSGGPLPTLLAPRAEAGYPTGRGAGGGGWLDAGPRTSSGGAASSSAAAARPRATSWSSASRSSRATSTPTSMRWRPRPTCSA